MKSIFILVIIVICANNTNAQEISNEAFKLNKYNSFGFTADDEEFLNSHPNAKRGLTRVKTAITQEMKEKGIQESKNPELLLNLGITVEEKVQTRETNIREAHYMGQRNYHWEVEEVPMGTYEEGSLSIDFVDVSEDEMVNQVIVTEVLTKNDKKMEKRIKKMISKTFKKL